MSIKFFAETHQKDAEGLNSRKGRLRRTHKGPSSTTEFQNMAPKVPHLPNLDSTTPRRKAHQKRHNVTNKDFQRTHRPVVALFCLLCMVSGSTNCSPQKVAISGKTAQMTCDEDTSSLYNGECLKCADIEQFRAHIQGCTDPGLKTKFLRWGLNELPNQVEMGLDELVKGSEIDSQLFISDFSFLGKKRPILEKFNFKQNLGLRVASVEAGSVNFNDIEVSIKQASLNPLDELVVDLGIELRILAPLETSEASIESITLNLEFFMKNHVIYREFGKPNPLERISLNFVKMNNNHKLEVIIQNNKAKKVTRRLQTAPESPKSANRRIPKIPIYYKFPLYTITFMGCLGLVLSVCMAGCLPIGVRFIKFFQIFKIMGKLIFVPVEYQGPLLKALEFIAALGQLIEADSKFLVENTEYFNMRSWGKFTLYGEPKNILQAIPISCIALIVRKNQKNSIFQKIQILTHFRGSFFSNTSPGSLSGSMRGFLQDKKKTPETKKQRNSR